MGLHYLFGLCLAVFSVSAIAAGPVSTEVAAGTTTYRVVNTTVKTPPNVTLSAAKDITPYVEKLPNKGLAQAAQGRLIVAQKAAFVPVSGFFNVSGAVVKSGAKTFFRTASRATVLGAGLQALLDTADWAFNDDGVLVHPLPIAGSPALKPRQIVLSDYPVHALAPSQVYISKEDEPNPRSVPGWFESGGKPFWFYAVENLGFTHRYWAFPDQLMDSKNNMAYLTAYSNSGPNEYWQDVGGYDYDFVAVEVPVTEQDISDAVESSYEPEPDDWKNLFPFIYPDGFTLNQPLPTLALAPSVSTSTDNSTGETTVTEINTSYDFSVSENGSSQPSLEVDETTRKVVYVNGVPVSDTTTSTTSKPSPGDESGSPSFELPSFCTWASVVCEWLDWTQEPLDDDLDLSQIITDDDFERDYSFSFGSSTCPEPIVFNVDFINQSVELSYQPACDLAGYAKPFVLISAYVFAIYIALGVVRNG